MKLRIPSLKRLLPLWLAGLASTLTLQAATFQNAGFDATTGWSGTFRGGANGGDSWTGGYFVGGAQPTGSTFACRFQSAVKQNLTGPGNTFVAGATYTISAQLFSAGNYGDSRGAKIMWSLGLTANGTPVASDHWFSDEFAAQSVTNGGTIPDNHILNVTTSSNGLTTATVTFVATAAEAGKTIGIQLNGDTQTKYAGVTGHDDWYGMMDNVTYTSNAILGSFTSDIQALDGNGGFDLHWTIDDPSQLTTLTLDSGSGPVDVKSKTDLLTGQGSIFVEPTATTTYTLRVNESQYGQLIVYGGKANTFTRDSNVRVATAPSYQVTLNWSVQPANATVTLSDGVNSIDVTADTDPQTGFGSKLVTVPNPSTIFTITANGSPLTLTTRVLREGANSAAFSINSASVVVGQPITVTWTGAAAAAKDWIGVYSIGETPGGSGTELSDAWNYLSGNRTPVAGFTDGTMNFTLPVGTYYVSLLLNDGYEIAQGPLMFTVVEPPPVVKPLQVTSITKDANGVTLVWNSKAGVNYNIYASNSLQGVPSQDWDKVSLALPSEGDDTTDFTETFESGAPARRFYQIEEALPAQ